MLAKDLIGVGVPAIQAAVLGDNPAAALTTAGTTGATSTAILLAQDFVLMTGAGSTDGLRLPAGTLLQQPYIVSNVSASSGTVYPPTGGNFTGNTTDAGISVPARKTMICWRYSATGWSYNLSA
jgi:hypothetical protein